MNKQWSADINVSEKLVRDLLKQQFPELIPAELELFDEGWDNSLFLVNGINVFRFPRRKAAADLIEMENRMLPQLSSRLTLPIPNPRFIGKPTRDYPYFFSGYTKIAGNAPHKLNLTGMQRSLSAVRLAEFLRSLHNIPISDALQWGIASSDDIGRMDVGKRIPLFISKVEEAHLKGLIDNGEALLNIINELSITDNNLQETNNAPAVVHGDLNFRNFLVDGDDGVLSGVIDWGDAHIGHPAIDLSVIYSFLPPNARPEFLKAYGEVNPAMLLLAKFRSLYINIVILIYAHDIGDMKQLLEAQRALAFTIG